MPVQVTPTAAVALALVPPASIAAFSRWRPAKAILVLLIGATLFLPERCSFKVPGLPPLDKHTITLLCLLIGVMITGRQQLGAAKPLRGIDLCIVGILIGCIGTMITNPEPLRYGKTTLPALTQSDLISDWIFTFLQVGTPFLLGRVFFRTSEDAILLLSGFVIGALIYTPFIMIELRLSPQLHRWIYGFAQQSFAETKRGGGYRPAVFMAHGLALALFVSASAFGAWALARRKYKVVKFASTTVVALWCSALLGLLHSTGALIYGIVGIPVAWFTKPKTQLRFAAVIAIIIALYPIMRLKDWFPAQALVDYTAQKSQERAQSIATRFSNEDAFLERALLKPYFGWGGWSRGHVYTPQGVDDSILDGAWLAMLQRGFVELTFDGMLLLFPVFMALRKVDKVAKTDQPLLAGVAMVSIYYTLDLLPNGNFNRLPMFCAGALAGLSQGMSAPGAGGLGNPNINVAAVRALAAELLARRTRRAPALTGGRS